MAGAEVEQSLAVGGIQRLQMPQHEHHLCVARRQLELLRAAARQE